MRPSKRKLPTREEKPLKEQGKTTNIVLDPSTAQLLAHFINTKLIKSVDYPLSQGKEAMVFRCTTGEKGKAQGLEEYLAVKVYKYETSSFQAMAKYIEGDQRFEKISKKIRPLVQEWAKKEFANLNACYNAKVSVPKPITRKKNVVFMQFIGEYGRHYALLKEVVLENPAQTYKDILDNMRRMHRKAGLVHADLSEYNIIMKNQTPIFIDVSQSVLLNHPLANEFLEKDVENIVKYFKREGVQNADFKKALEFIKGKENTKTNKQ